jgi:hypothetical protein
MLLFFSSVALLILGYFLYGRLVERLFVSDTGAVHVRGTYPDDGGLISEDVAVTFTGPDAGEGLSAWRWANAWHPCGGRFRFYPDENRQ